MRTVLWNCVLTLFLLLRTAHPLAAGFPIMAGTISVTVPDVDTRDDYVVVCKSLC